MHGTGPVTVNGAGVDGYFTDRAGGVRLRLSLDDWDRLGLCEGQRVVVGRPGRAAVEYLVAEAATHPPVVWLSLTPRPPRATGQG